MKCEICKQAEAETVLRETIDGQLRERFVCQACARRQQDASKPATSSTMLVEILLETALAMQGRPTGSKQAGKDLKCPACGITYAHYRKHSRLGCASCYQSFANELRPVLREMHRGDHHTGKCPPQARLSLAKKRLEMDLKKAVDEQKFEEAALLRDRIHALAITSETAPGRARVKNA